MCLTRAHWSTRARAGTVALTLGLGTLSLGTLSLGTLSLGTLSLGSVTAHAASVALTPSASDLTSFWNQDITWKPCPNADPSADCARLRVPLDYERPGGRTLDLHLRRYPHTQAGPAAGVIVTNPGGPGVPGQAVAGYVHRLLGPTVTGTYDVVGFDPRGTGASSPITCLSGGQTTRWLRLSPLPRTAAQERRLLAAARQMARGCRADDAELAAHIGTSDSVRDLDVIRRALRQPRLDYLGFSYGTYLGARYAQTYPTTTGRMVLDGAIDPSLHAMTLSAGQNAGFQDAIHRFAADCALRADCPWRGGTGAVLTRINGLLTVLERTPARADPGRPLVIAEAITAVISSLYSDTRWPALRTALAAAERGDGRPLQVIADAEAGRIGPDTYATNASTAFYAIGCWDSPVTPGAAGMRAAAERWSRDAHVPALATALAWSAAPCSQWFGHEPARPQAIGVTTTSPILIIGTTHDPATPYRWAQALHAQMPTSVLLTFDGDGHTAFGRGSVCVDTAVRALFARDERPPANTVCRR